MNNKICKLASAKQFLEHSTKIKFQLFDELINGATNDIIFKRRFRMISQLDDFESQAIKKIYQFDSDNPEDYQQGLNRLLIELNNVTSRNA